MTLPLSVTLRQDVTEGRVTCGYDGAVTTDLGPTVRRKQLGAKLRELRNQAGLRMEDAAEKLGCARSRISHIELGRNAVRKPDLEVLVRLYLPPDRVDEVLPVLEELRREGARPGWWSTYRLPDWLQGLVGLEIDATRERVFQVELIPALLQTEEYARAVHAAGPRTTPTEEVERRIAARLQRQQRLGDLQLWAVISETALLSTLTAPKVAAGQLRYLTDAAQRDNTEVQILRHGFHGSMTSPFTVLQFAPGVSLDVAYLEHPGGGHLVDDQDVVQLLTGLHDDLRDQALGTSESLDLISELARQAESEETLRA